MIGRLLGPSRFQVDPAVDRPIGQWLRCLDMIDAPTLPVFDSVPRSIVVVGVVAALGHVLAEYINEAPVRHLVKSLGHLWIEANVAEQSFGIVDVDVCRCNVDITDPDDGLIGGETRLEQGSQSVKPFQLVLIHLVVDITTLRHVRIHHSDSANFSYQQT